MVGHFHQRSTWLLGCQLETRKISSFSSFLFILADISWVPEFAHLTLEMPRKGKGTLEEFMAQDDSSQVNSVLMLVSLAGFGLQVASSSSLVP